MFVAINGVNSSQMELEWSFPQASVLGIILFTTGSALLFEIIRQYGVQMHLYVDDTQ